jgi:hypothetical protein
MDTMKLLLGTIIALLLAALVGSWHEMQTGSKNASPEDKQRLGKQLEAIELQMKRDAMERQLLQQSGPLAVAPPPDSAENTALKAQVEENRRQLAQLAEEKAKAERDAKLNDNENLLLSGRAAQEQNSLMREARLVSQALLIGKITQFAEDAQVGSFVTIQILMPEQVQQDTILAIRRKTGILGQIKITSIEGGEAIGNPLPGFGTIQPEPGDELILPPRF